MSSKLPPSLQTEVSPTVKPGDDFYRYVNQKWLDAHPLPDAKAANNAFSVLDDENAERLKTLLELPTAESESKATSLIKTFYRTAMDEAAIEQRGITALKPTLQVIAAIQNSQAIKDFISDYHSQGRRMVWDMDYDIDDKDSSRYIARTFQAGLGLPDREYYFEIGERFETIRLEYTRFLTELFELLGYDDPAARAKSAYAVETTLAKVSKTATEKRDSEANYNFYTIKSLTNEFPDFDWAMYFKRIGMGAIDSVVISQPEFIRGVLKAIEKIDVADWQNYLTVRSVVPLMPSLPRAYAELSFDFYGTVINGVKEQEPRYRRVIAAAVGKLPEPAGRLYVQHHFDETAKQTIEDLVEHIKTALHTRIAKLDWMDNNTKQRAYQKLDSFVPLLGYPDNWRNYDGLTLGDNHCENLLTITRFEWQYGLTRLMKPVDRREWLISSATVNAIYWPNANSITFPAAILQPPFFSADSGCDIAANYGGIGVVIGHEISHGFDDQGSLYDETGNLKSWWTAADRTAFEERTKQLEAQYNGYEIDGRQVNGALTLGENIGDLGGMLIAYDALQKHLQETGRTEAVDGFTPEQRFFMSLARIWRGNQRPELTLRRLVSDPHSPGKLRVNGVVTNIDAFYTAFDVQEGDALYQDPATRVRIW